MDWLSNITRQTTVLVPTRGLQHSLSQYYINLQIQAGKDAWETPQIVVWDDYINLLWQANKNQLGFNRLRLDSAQAFLVWQQIILEQKKQNNTLLLLNEQQTANVAMRSWQLLHKWQIDPQVLQTRDDIDSNAFSQWCEVYTAKLEKQHWIDSAQIEKKIVDATTQLKALPEKLIFASFDLLTQSQQQHQQCCQQIGIHVEQQTIQYQMENSPPKTYEYNVFQQVEQEWQSIFQRARQLLEQQPETQIGIVIPDLAEQRDRVEQIARTVFYPDKSPLDCQQQDIVYRFSLGRPLSKIAYIHAILTSLSLLKNNFRYQDISYLLMSEWWPFSGTEDHNRQLISLELERALKQKRCAWLNWEEVLQISLEVLPEVTELHQYIQQLIDFRNQLYVKQTADEKPQFKSAREWQQIFSEWLQLLEWQNNDLDSWHFQAHESWLQVLETFIGYDLIQGKISLARALLNLNSLCSDKVFMRQAKTEPILISGVLEGVGHPVDYLFVTGMHEAYPPQAPHDPFIPLQALAEQDYPFADKNTEFQYEQNKLNSLFAGGKQVFVSYAKQHDDGEYSPTTLLRDKTFTEIDQINKQPLHIELEQYIDSQGQLCLNSESIRGGAKVFENQSNCPFKAYIEHRIVRYQEEEPEFGLDARDAGIEAHHLLDNIWRELVSSSELSAMDESTLTAFIARHIDNFLDNPPANFQYDRLKLLQLEKPRLNRLLFEWLSLEQEQRSMGYSVIGRETPINSQFGGIPVKLVIDRIDRLDTGDCLIIDYKTGRAELADWAGERPVSPQLPLYALALTKQTEPQYHQIQGIAYAKLKYTDVKLVGLTDVEGVGADLKPPKHERQNISWQQQLDIWDQHLSQLATDFLAGIATVDPLKADTCNYCDLQHVCRVNQLRSQSQTIELDAS